MLANILEMNFTNEKEKELLKELCFNEQIKNEVIEHIQIAKENDFTPYLHGLLTDLIQEPSSKFIEYVENQREIFFSKYGVKHDIFEQLESDFLEPVSVDTIGNHIRVAFQTDVESDHLILSLSGAYRELAKIYSNHFNEVVLVFVNGTNAKHICI